MIAVAFLLRFQVKAARCWCFEHCFEKIVESYVRSGKEVRFTPWSSSPPNSVQAAARLPERRPVPWSFGIALIRSTEGRIVGSMGGMDARSRSRRAPTNNLRAQVPGPVPEYSFQL